MRKPLPDTRICNTCGAEFKPTRFVHRCKPCVNELARSVNQRVKEEKIKSGEYIPYGDIRPVEMQINEVEREKKYRALRRMISLMERDEYREYLTQKLTDIMYNGPLWRYLIREGLGSYKPPAETKPKLNRRQKMVKSGDTRNLSWDDLESMGFSGLDEDK